MRWHLTNEFGGEMDAVLRSVCALPRETFDLVSTFRADHFFCFLSTHSYVLPGFGNAVARARNGLFAQLQRYVTDKSELT